MITEDYVSFETAKLLKEKGFDAECHSHYYPCHYPDGSIEYHRDKSAQSRTKIWYNVYSLKNLPKDHYLAPTIQMAMKWLRETHDFNVNTELNIHGYFCSLSHIVRDLSGHIIDIEDSEAWETAYYDSYEQAVESAVKYCLENLI